MAQLSGGYGFDKAARLGLLCAMFGFLRKRSGRDLVAALHGRIVDASRRADLYGPGGLPDTTEGRFESLVLHVLLVLRQLRRLPPPADDVSQDLIDSLFAHLEIALREMGIGDFGVPKRMKKLAEAFYDRTSKYDPLFESGNAGGLAAEIGSRLAVDGASVRPAAESLIASERRIRGLDLDTILRGPDFAAVSGRSGADEISLASAQ